ncbi:hypothetical protein GCM10023115_37870 [Pontixanthobacter gangjinensis]
MTPQIIDFCNKFPIVSFYKKTIIMKKFILALLVSFSLAAQAYCQEFSGKVLDQKTREAIPFATVQYAANRGVITNDEGAFSINRPVTQLKELKISSVGYKTREVDIADLADNIIYLETDIIQLDDVFLSDKKLSAEEILERAKERVAENYNIGNINRRFFFRESNLNKVKTFDLDIQESTIEDIDQKLMDSISASIPKSSDSYKEVLGDFSGDYTRQKVDIIKGANLHNPQSTASLDKLTDKLDRIFKENVKPDSYLKIKSGWLGVKVDVDEFSEENEKENKKPTKEEIAKSEEEKKQSLVSSANSKIPSLLSESFWDEDAEFDLFDRLNRYKFKVAGYTYLDNSLVYVIDFEPKGGSDFRGRLYVNTEDFGVHRIDYANVKPLKKFRLLGISSIDDVYRGKMIYSRDENGHYLPKYFEQEVGESFGIDRPLQLIEKNKNVVGRRKQNELDMDILIKVSQLEKYQLVVFNDAGEEMQAPKESSEDFEYQTFKKYDPEFWKGYNIIEPNAAIREFTAITE